MPSFVVTELTYDGHGFAGSADQPGQRTVQGTLTDALVRLGEPGAAPELASRTDAGVHARGQVAWFAPARTRDAAAWWRALDRHLPDDLRPRRVALAAKPPVVRHKTYRYLLDVGPVGDPWARHTHWRVEVDPAVLRAHVHAWVGTHDFVAFRRRGETRTDLVRTIVHGDAWLDGETVVISVTGTGFTYRLVRSLVGATVAVAQGRAAPEDLSAALAGQARDVARHQAPARGLHLWEAALTTDLDWWRP